MFCKMVQVKAPPVKSPPGHKAPPPGSPAAMRATPKEPPPAVAVKPAPSQLFVNDAGTGGLPAGSRVFGIVSMPAVKAPPPHMPDRELQPAAQRPPPLPEAALAESVLPEIPFPSAGSAPDSERLEPKTEELKPRAEESQRKAVKPPPPPRRVEATPASSKPSPPPRTVDTQRPIWAVEPEPKTEEPAPGAEEPQPRAVKPPPPQRTVQFTPESSKPSPPLRTAEATPVSSKPPPPPKSLLTESTPKTAQPLSPLAKLPDELSTTAPPPAPPPKQLGTPEPHPPRPTGFKPPPVGIENSPDYSHAISSSSTHKAPPTGVPADCMPAGYKAPPAELLPQLVSSPQFVTPKTSGGLSSPYDAPGQSSWEPMTAYGPIRTDTTNVSPDGGILAEPARPAATPEYFDMSTEPPLGMSIEPSATLPDISLVPASSADSESSGPEARTRSSSPELVPAYTGIDHVALQHVGTCEGRGRRWPVHGKYWNDKGQLCRGSCPCCSRPRECPRCLILQDMCQNQAARLANLDSEAFSEEAFRFWNARCDEGLVQYFEEQPEILPEVSRLELASHYKNDLTESAQPGVVVFAGEAPHLANWQWQKKWEWIQSGACKDFWFLSRQGSLPFLHDMEELVDGWPPDMTPLERNGWILCNHVEQRCPRGPIFFDMSCGDNLHLPSPPRGTVWRALRKQRYVLQPKLFVDEIREPFAYLYRAKDDAFSYQ